MIKASIIIPTFNKLLRLKLVLKSLECQVTDEIEVIVVFDGCSPETIEQFRLLNFTFTPIQIVCRENAGCAAARNRGIEKSKGNIVIFLDDDRIVSPTFIKEHLLIHRTVGRAAVVFGIRKEFYLSDDNISAYANATDGLREYCEKNGDIQEYFLKNRSENYLFRWFNFYTGNVSVDRESLLKAGCFDEFFKGWGHEDLDLGIRLALHKVSFYYADHAENYHMMHPSNFLFDKKSSDDHLKYMIKKYMGHPLVQIILFLLKVKEDKMGFRISAKQNERFEAKERAALR